MFCKNEGSKRSKINEKGGPSISGTKCDRDRPCFSTERGVNQMRYTLATQTD